MKDYGIKDLYGFVRVGSTWARYGLDVAATSVDYAGNVLHDVSKQLRETGRRIDTNCSECCTPSEKPTSTTPKQ